MPAGTIAAVCDSQSFRADQLTEVAAQNAVKPLRSLQLRAMLAPHGGKKFADRRQASCQIIYDMPIYDP